MPSPLSILRVVSDGNLLEIRLRNTRVKPLTSGDDRLPPSAGHEIEQREVSGVLIPNPTNIFDGGFKPLVKSGPLRLDQVLDLTLRDGGGLEDRHGEVSKQRHGDVAVEKLTPERDALGRLTYGDGGQHRRK